MAESESHRIYADHNATSPVRPEAVQAMLTVLEQVPGNPSSIHREGREASGFLEKARAQVAGLVGAEPREVVFTSGATEAANLAIRALTARFSSGRIVLSAIEHPAVANSCDLLRHRGFQVEVLPVTRQGTLDMEQASRALRSKALVVCVMLANNEVGTIQPIEDLAPLVRDVGAFFVVDAVQAAGKIPVDIQKLGADILLLSAHKFGGPKGVGAMVVRRGTRLEPVLGGGGQEFGLRPGTQNLPGIAGMGAAAEAARRDLPKERERLEDLRDTMEKALVTRLDGTRVMGHTALRLPNTSNLVFDAVEGDALQMNLDLEGIAVSTTSACSAGTGRPSRVLQAMGLDSVTAASSIRISLGWTNGDKDGKRIARVVEATVTALRK